jgi:hypothetical protein
MLLFRLGKMLPRVIGTLAAAAVLPVALALQAQQTSIVKLIVEKKPGASEGRAMATVKGPLKVKGKVVIGEKTGRIATKAIQAWIIMDGQGASLLLSPEKLFSSARWSVLLLPFKIWGSPQERLT